MSENQKISRRNLIKKFTEIGIIITIPEFISYCSSSRNFTNENSKGKLSEDKDSPFTIWPVAYCSEIGITAPNAHNTQPWKFEFDSPLKMKLYVDEKRLLTFTDPPFRQTHISQGTFIELFTMAAKSIGYNTDVSILPEKKYNNEKIGKSPIAILSLKKEGIIKEDRLFPYYKNRITDRTVFENENIPEESITKLIQLTEPKYSNIKIIHNQDQLNEYHNLFYKATEVESYYDKAGEETFKWFRFSEKELKVRKDGLSLRGSGFSGFTLWLIENFLMDKNLESFTSKETTETYLKNFKNVVYSSKAYALFITEENTFKSWIQVGRDYLRFHLAITFLNLKMHPLSQILQEYPKMDSLRKEFEGLNGIKGKQKIQMAVRIGKSSYNYFSPRRTVTDMKI
ncbi:MAG: hypothetical protein KDK36_15415 [Leptospiraceae bacterium]|nr:hypothetical protein [Leptospiraceae bacterium]